ncbi:MAG TPA: hypothetical protein VFX48_06475, partial [Saprospiraceae bacterium]|nr:hypothetical protein [Saprospiraceae bacterium]
KAALWNGVIMLAIGFWGYAANQFAAHTAFVPLGFGLYLVAVSRFLKEERAGLFFFNAGITLVVMLAMTRPLLRNAEQSDGTGMLRVGLEMLACAMALIVYYRNWKLIKGQISTPDEK